MEGQGLEEIMMKGYIGTGLCRKEKVKEKYNVKRTTKKEKKNSSGHQWEKVNNGRSCTDRLIVVTTHTK